MVSRKDVYGMLLSPLLALVGLGCAHVPLQPLAESTGQQSQAGQATRGSPYAQPFSGLRIPMTPTEKSALGANGSREIVQAGASGSSPSPYPLPPEGGKGRVRPQGSGGGSPPVVTTATPSSFPNDTSVKLHTLYREAAQRYAHIDSYIVRLTRREQLNGKDKPEEILLFKFRKEPWSVYFKWLGTEGKGREVVYVPGQYENKIHTLLAAGDMPLMAAGRRFAVAPDNPLVLSSSRHPIQQAGVGMLIERFGKWLDDTDKGGHAPGALKFLGPMQRPEFGGPCEAVEQTIAAGVEPQLPRGGRRLWVFDAETKFPVLIITHDDAGHEVEYYFYDRFEFPVHLDDDDFNPEKLWNPKREGTPQK